MARYKYLSNDPDRNGNARTYLRRPGARKIRLFSEVGTPEFIAEYGAAMRGERPAPPRKRDPVEGRIEVLAEAAVLRARKRAYEHRRTFGLTVEDSLQLLRRQSYRCAVSGLKFRAPDAPGFREPYAPSLDRINSALGYDPDNTRWVLTAVNIALSDWGEDQLVQIAAAIVVFNQRKHPR